MDIISHPVIDIVKAVGLTFKKYVKYQFCHQHYVHKFERTQKNLKSRLEDVDARVEEQLQPGKIAGKDVNAWRQEARNKTAVRVEHLICKGGCFTHICSSRKLDKKTQELNEGIFILGEKYTNPGVSLVVDDQSIEYFTTVFKEKQKQLKSRQKGIEEKLKTQLMQPEKIASQEVEDWLKKASQQIPIKVEDLIPKGECPSSFNLRRKTEELKQILEEGEKYSNAGKSLVVDDHSIKGAPLLVEECNGRDGIQEQILEWLKGDKVTRIAVCGMGGVGKTTIMKQVHNQLLKESKFNNVFWVKVSKDFDIIVQQKTEFDILKFQKRIASTLEIKLEPEDHENETKVAELISQRLGQGSNVLILDDVWQQFRPEDVRIPDLVGNNGCKLVLTTRLKNVARAMDCEVILVDPLPPDEALALFLEKVRSEVLSDGKIERDIEPFLKQILHKCDRVPLAIVTVAKSMRGKLHPHSWKLALSEFNEFSEFKGILDCLKFSYECLESQWQKCFLYCALYPEDHEIPKEELIEYWIEEGLIYKEGKTREAMHWKGHDILDNLVDNCMLESVKTKYKGDCVSMHDLLREMALKISPQFLVKAGMGLEKLTEEHEWRKDLLKVSLMMNYITEIPSSMPSPKCPMLTTLLLSNNKISTIPEAFFEQMLGLKILDLSYNLELSRLPSSISKLEKLTTLLLRGCVSLIEVPFLSNFGDLNKLDLSGTSIEEVPQGLNMLTNLKYLCLGGEIFVEFRRILSKVPDEFDRRLSKIPDGLLQNLSKLQHLRVGAITPLKGEEIRRLEKLEYLKGQFSSVHDMSIFFNSGGKFLNMYNLFIGSYNRGFSSHQELKTIVCCDIDICGEPKWLPSDVQRLDIYKCKDVRSLNDISGFEDVTDLRSVHVGCCDGIECILSGPWLNSLQNLEEVRAVAKSAPLPTGTFSSLEIIFIEDCHKIKKLFSIRWLGCLQSLKTIAVARCQQMEEIIWSEYEGGEKALEKVALPKLESLSFESLPQLKSINSSNTILICDSIKKITISICENIESLFWSRFNPLPTLEHLDLAYIKNLKSVFDEEALGLLPPLVTTPTISFSLKEIRIQSCPQLKNVFSSGWLLGYFQSLETIWVWHCTQMEELISSSACEEEKVTLPNLKSLELNELYTLKSIYRNSSVLVCDSIERLTIFRCENLKRIPLNFGLLDNAQSSPPPSLKQICVGTKRWWESLEWDHSNAKDVLLPLCEFLLEK